MKNGKAIIQDCKKRGYVEHEGVLYPPAMAKALGLIKVKNKKVKHIKTGWIDDTRNIANKEKQTDAFIVLVKQQLGIDAWPEFHFLLPPHPDYRFDYAFPFMANSPQLKIAIEVEGGVWAKGNSGHSSGTGIMRDMKKSSLAAVNGWILIRRIPDDLLTMETLDLIKKAINSRANYNLK